MALFNNDGKSKEEKKEEKIAAKLEKFGLNDLSDPYSREMTKKILDGLFGTFSARNTRTKLDHHKTARSNKSVDERNSFKNGISRLKSPIRGI